MPSKGWSITKSLGQRTCGSERLGLLGHRFRSLGRRNDNRWLCYYGSQQMIRELALEMRTAAIWAAFGLGLLFATRPVWSYLLLGSQLTLDELVSLRCFGTGLTGIGAL
jgi:hypothetical protein